MSPTVEMLSPLPVVRGHGDVYQRLARAWERGRLAQAYLFLGPEGIGKQLVARQFAQALLCQLPDREKLQPCRICDRCRAFQAGVHPDFHWVERDAGRRELTVDKFIGPRELRGQAGLCHDLTRQPLPGGRKVGVINDADWMNEEASNALLKTLEEPPPSVVLILIAARRDGVLPTIRSRCQSVMFAPLAVSDVAEILLSRHQISIDQAQEWARWSGGSVSRAESWLEPEIHTLRQELWRALFLPAQTAPLVIAQRLIEGIEKARREPAEQRLLAEQLVQASLDFLRLCIHGLIEFDPTSRPLEVQQWLHPRRDAAARWLQRLDAACECCFQTLDQLEQNAALPLCLQAWCHALFFKLRE
ncbi:MAG: ATPase AAA [Planctomycetaceae bacterium]|nr:MAG: ATPase AAA [Planctomycetaceae bacterium]